MASHTAGFSHYAFKTDDFTMSGEHGQAFSGTHDS